MNVRDNDLVEDKIFSKIIQLLNDLLFDERLPKELNFDKIYNRESNYKLIITDVIFYYISDFEFKLNISNYSQNFDSELDESHNQFIKIIDIVEEFLLFSNSKFLLKSEDGRIFSKIEFINMFIYFVTEYNFFDNFIDSINQINKKYVQINLDNLMEISEDNMNDKNNNLNNNMGNFLINFNKFNQLSRYLKKQIDSMINMSYKLKEILKNQPSPIKYNRL